jgi:hypothetical protein
VIEEYGCKGGMISPDIRTLKGGTRGEGDRTNKRILPVQELSLLNGLNRLVIFVVVCPIVLLCPPGIPCVNFLLVVKLRRKGMGRGRGRGRGRGEGERESAGGRIHFSGHSFYHHYVIFYIVLEIKPVPVF